VVNAVTSASVTFNWTAATLSSTPNTGNTPAGTAFSGQLSTTGGSGTITYTQSAGGPNITVSPSGAISAPATLHVGLYSATGGTSDGFGDSGTWNFDLPVTATTLSSTPTTGTTTAGIAFSGQLATAGGSGTLTYTQSAGGPNITVSPSGAISAPATLPVGSYKSTGATSDALGDSGTWFFTLTVTATTLSSTPTTGTTTAGIAFSGQLATAGGSGTLTYAQSAGGPNITVSPSGAISAPPTLHVGNYTATGATSDALGDSGTWSFTLSVTGTTLSSTPTTGTTTAGIAFSGQLSTTGGSGTLTYTQSAGGPNITVSSSGAISAPATLPVGSYKSTGATSDALGDSGTWFFTLTIGPNPTATSEMSSGSPSLVGQSVIYTATVTPAGHPSNALTGNVEFFSGGTPIAVCGGSAGVPLSSGKAICAVTYENAGTYSITAKYLGSSTYLASAVSASVNQVVNGAGTTLVAAPVSVVGSLFHLSVTFSATLTSKVTGAGIPGQSVVFAGNGRTCTGTTNANGVATCTVPVLDIIGLLLHPKYTASYGGTANYKAANGTGAVTLF
jgi:hypothetical protein